MITQNLRFVMVGICSLVLQAAGACAQSQPGSAAGTETAAPQTAARITWKVENPFRFFLDPADTDIHRATYEDLSDEERRTPVLSSERALAARHPEGWAATMVSKTCWDAKKNRYVCPDGKPYVTPNATI
jgi:hypothetical protein